jgi:hypothetical protein
VLGVIAGGSFLAHDVCGNKHLLHASILHVTAVALLLCRYHSGHGRECGSL